MDERNRKVLLVVVLAVDVAGERDGYCFFESELEPTGRKFQREDFYDGASVRVRVDSDGRGYLSK